MVVVFVIALALVATATAAYAAIITDSYGGCEVWVLSHEHWGNARVEVQDNNGGCERIRAEHIYDSNGAVTTTSGWTISNKISLTNGGDECKGRGGMDPYDISGTKWSMYAIHDLTNC